MESVMRPGEDAVGFEKMLLASAEKADATFAAQQAEEDAATLKALNGEEIKDKLAEARRVCGNVIDRIREIMYEGGKMKRFSVEDPAQIERFWRLYDRFDKAAALYLEGKIPRNTQYEITIKDYGGGARVKGTEPKPGITLMGAALDLFIFIALL